MTGPTPLLLANGRLVDPSQGLDAVGDLLLVAPTARGGSTARARWSAPG
jgi:hypothetical protein